MIVVIERLSSRPDSGPAGAGVTFLSRTDRTEGACLTAEVHVETVMMTLTRMHGHDHAIQCLLNQFGK
jgi:hypothetical protein